MGARAEIVTRVAPRPAGRTIAVASGKGGVGKTWLSITLAQCLARKGQKTLLFDGDLGLANVDVQLGLFADGDLGSFVSEAVGLKDIVTKFPAGGFDIVAGRSGSGSMAGLSSTRIERLAAEVNDLSRSYDRVIMDLGAGIEAPVRMLAARAATCLVVTSDEPTALTDAYAFIKVLVASRANADIRIVVNFAATARAGERTYQTLARACEEFLKISPPLAGIVRRDAKVRDAIRTQTPLIVRHPTADAAADVDALAASLLARP